MGGLLSLCMIVKNEEKVLARALDGVCAYVDEIVIADTGSTDGTKAAAAEYTDSIFDFEWCDDFAAARNYIQFGRYREALNVLSGIQERTAEWYFLAAAANAGAGNRVQAQQYAQQAVRMEPNNMEYQALYERLQEPGQTYTTFGRGYSMPMFDGYGRICIGLCLAQSMMGLCCRWC